MLSLDQVSLSQVDIPRMFVPSCRALARPLFSEQSDLVMLLTLQNAAGCATGVVCGLYAGLTKPSSARQHVSSGLVYINKQDFKGDSYPPVPYSPCGIADQVYFFVRLSMCTQSMFV